MYEAAGAILNGGLVAEVRAVALTQERERKCMQPCNMQPASIAWWRNGKIVKNSLRPKPKEKWFFVDKRRESMKHRTEWCAEANRYPCMRCGKGSRYMKMPGRCDGPKFLSKRLENWRRRHRGGHDLVRRIDRQGEVLIWCRKCSG